MDPGSSPWNSSAPLSTGGYVGSGDNAWQLTAASLVALQSVPGLVVLYAGIVKTKWAINSAFMAFYAFAMTLVCWVLWAYKVGFGDQMLPFAGHPRPVMTIQDELQQAYLPTLNVAPNMPQATMVYFQFVFAAITIVIMAGAFLGRMNFTAWVSSLLLFHFLQMDWIAHLLCSVTALQLCNKGSMKRRAS
jgi:Amt family ammonium transporter